MAVHDAEAAVGVLHDAAADCKRIALAIAPAYGCGQVVDVRVGIAVRECRHREAAGRLVLGGVGRCQLGEDALASPFIPFLPPFLCIRFE